MYIHIYIYIYIGLQWGTATMLDSVLRLMQFHVQLDEDDAGVLYSRVPYR